MPPVDHLKPIRAKSSESGYTVIEFMREFPDEATCLEHLWRTCYSPMARRRIARSASDRRSKKHVCETRRQSWTCTGCGHHVHPTAGTIFEKSSISLVQWFYAMFLGSSPRCVIAAKQSLHPSPRPHLRRGRDAYAVRRKARERPLALLDSEHVFVS